MRLAIAVLAFALIAPSSAAYAQTDANGDLIPIAATSLQELQPLLNAGVMLDVTDQAGAKVRGTLASGQPPSFDAFAKQPLALPDAPLQAWWADDGVANGVTRGFLIGAAGGAVVIGRACYGAIEGNESLLGCTVLGSLLVAGGGAVAGLIVDVLIRHKELHVDYRLPARKRTATLMPVLTRRGAAASMSILF